jgi:hypothetical protein
VLGHEVESTRRAALDRLPAFDRQALRPRHQRDFLQCVAAIGHLGRDRVEAALMAEALLVEGLEDDVDAFLEHLAVGCLVGQRRAEALDLAGVIATRHAEDHPPGAQDVGHGVVFGEPQRMPHRHDIEAAADLEVPGLVDQVHRHHQQVGDALGAFGLEMVFRHPEGVVAQPVHLLCVCDSFVQCTRQLVVGIMAVVDRRPAIAEVFHIDRADIRTVEPRDHGCDPFDFSDRKRARMSA